MHLLTAFYDTGVADDSLFTYQPMDFDVGLGFPLMAKIMVVVVVVLLIGLYLLIRFIVRRVRRRSGGSI